MILQNHYFSEICHDFKADYVKRDTPFFMESYHYHKTYEIYYCIEGERRLFLKDRIYHVTAGDLVFINKYELHSVNDWTTPGHARIVLSINDEWLESLNMGDIDIFSCFHRGIVVAETNPKQQEWVLNRLLEIVDEYNEKAFGSDIRLKAMTIDLLIALNRILDHCEDKTSPHSQKDKMISDIMQYLTEHYKEDFSLEKISLEFGYSKNYLCSLFKQVSGFSMVAYLNAIRVKEAQRLLKSTKHSIAEISEMTGYENITHFGRVFKEVTGCSPLSYRKKFSHK